MYHRMASEAQVPSCFIDGHSNVVVEYLSPSAWGRLQYCEEYHAALPVGARQSAWCSAGRL